MFKSIHYYNGIVDESLIVVSTPHFWVFCCFPKFDLEYGCCAVLVRCVAKVIYGQAYDSFGKIVIARI